MSSHPLVICVCVVFVHMQVWSQGFPLGADHEAGSGGDKPEQEAVIQSHARLQDLRLVCVSTDRPTGGPGDDERAGGSRVPHVPRCLATAGYHWGVRLCPVNRGVSNTPAFQNPNGKDDLGYVYIQSISRCFVDRATQISADHNQNTQPKRWTMINNRINKGNAVKVINACHCLFFFTNSVLDQLLLIVCMSQWQEKISYFFQSDSKWWLSGNNATKCHTYYYVQQNKTCVVLSSHGAEVCVWGACNMLIASNQC